MKTPLRIAIVGIVALMLSLGAWTVGGRAEDEAERRATIANKTQAERDQLRRRYDEFKQLSKTERDEVRRLHEAVERDPGLARTLADYEAFVSRLDPLDQQELQQKDGIQARMALVEKLIAERVRTDRPGRPSWLFGRFAEGPVLPPSQFGRAVDLLAASLELPQTELRRIEELPRPEQRHLAIIKHAVARRGNDRGRPWLDEETTDEVLELLPEGRTRDWLLSEKTSSEFRRASIPSLLARSLLAEWQMIVPLVIPQAQIEAALEKVPERDQADWARRDPGRLQRAIVEELEKQPGSTGEFARQFDEVVRLRNDLDPFARDRRRHFGRPPFGGSDRGDDRRGRDEDHRGRDGDHNGRDGDRRGSR